jgi:hypothetical protein
MKLGLQVVVDVGWVLLLPKSQDGKPAFTSDPLMCGFCNQNLFSTKTYLCLFYFYSLNILAVPSLYNI